VRVKRAERLKEEAMFYGGGEVEEVRDDSKRKKTKRNKAPRRDANQSSIVCLGYRSRPDIEDSDAEEKAASAAGGDEGRTEMSVVSRKSMVAAAAAAADDEGSKETEDDGGGGTMEKGTVVTQIDYVNYFIPFLAEITACPYYWGKIDRYEAEALLENKPEGSFLLRDSAQDEFVFSVSFRRYNRSLHARIEESRHEFSFDCHDPGVHSSRSVCGLLEHYKDPLSCMFFEPMLLYPVLRRSCFSLQELARAAICDSCKFDRVSQLPLPQTLKAFLRDYSYKHKIRTRQLDMGCAGGEDTTAKGAGPTGPAAAPGVSKET